jgi:hypothetical protein
MKSARAMPAVAVSLRPDLYVPITCAKMRKDSHHGSLLSRGLPCTASHREAQYRGAPAVCIAVHGRLQVDCIAAVEEAIVSSASTQLARSSATRLRFPVLYSAEARLSEVARRLYGVVGGSVEMGFGSASRPMFAQADQGPSAPP